MNKRTINVLVLFSFLAIQLIPWILHAQNNSTNNDAEILLELESAIDYSIFGRDKISSNWWGSRDIIEQKGLEISLDYTGEVWSNQKGGIQKKSDYLHNIDMVFNFDFEKMLNWNGATLNAYVLGNYGGIPSKSSGTLQGISNIAAYDTWKVYQLWLQQNLFDDKLSLLFGLFDLNSEFDARETSSIFINPSHGIGPDYAQSGLNGPSIFPTASLALRIKYQLSNDFYFSTAVFDGVSGNPDNPNGTHIKFSKEDGALFAGEFVYKANPENFGEGFAKVAIGGWYYTTEFEEIFQPVNLDNPLMKKGSYGLYVFAEKFIYAESLDPEQGLAGFIRAGFADDIVNPFDFYLGSGFTYTGPFPGREKDVIGIAFALAQTGDPFKQSAEQEGFSIEDYELAIELTYSFSLLQSISFQPDLQYIINPSTIKGVDNSLVFGTRMTMAF
jgi:porin